MKISPSSHDVASSNTERGFSRNFAHVAMGIAGAVFVIDFFVILFVQDATLKTIIGDSSFFIAALCASVVSWCVWNTVQDAEKKSWVCIASAITLWALGDAAWAFSEIFLDDSVPIGSLPDLFWHGGYVLLIIGGIFLSRIVLKRTDFSIFLTLLLTFGLLYIVPYIFTGILTFSSLRLENILQVFYVFHDVFLLAIFYTIVLKIGEYNLESASAVPLLAIAITLRALYDPLFASMTLHETYETGVWIDLLYLGSYVALAQMTFWNTKTRDV